MEKKENCQYVSAEKCLILSCSGLKMVLKQLPTCKIVVTLGRSPDVCPPGHLPCNEKKYKWTFAPQLKMQPGHLPPRAYFEYGCLPPSAYFADGHLPPTAYFWYGRLPSNPLPDTSSIPFVFS